MIEALILSLALSCGASEPPYPTSFTQVALDVYRQLGDRDITVPADHPLAALYGTDRPELPVEPVEEFSEVTYDVWADPLYDESCFSDFVDSVLGDDRSWPGLRRVEVGETPQFWVTLTSPAGACGSYKNPRASCAWNNKDGTGVITLNALRWHRGYGYEDDQAMLINHEVGHILGFDHYDCSVMGHPAWTPAAGYPTYESEWTDCDIPAWPSDAEREAAEVVYTERWLEGADGPWTGAEFVARYLAG